MNKAKEKDDFMRGDGKHPPSTFNKRIDMTGTKILGSYVLNVIVWFAAILAFICVMAAFASGQNVQQQHEAIVNGWLNDRAGKPGPTNLNTYYSSIHHQTVDDWENDRIYYGRTYNNGYSIHNYNPALQWSLWQQQRIWQTQYNANPWNWSWNNNYYPRRYLVIP